MRKLSIKLIYKEIFFIKLNTQPFPMLLTFCVRNFLLNTSIEAPINYINILYRLI